MKNSKSIYYLFKECGVEWPIPVARPNIPMPTAAASGTHSAMFIVKPGRLLFRVQLSLV